MSFSPRRALCSRHDDRRAPRRDMRNRPVPRIELRIRRRSPRGRHRARLGMVNGLEPVVSPEFGAASHNIRGRDSRRRAQRSRRHAATSHAPSRFDRSASPHRAQSRPRIRACARSGETGVEVLLSRKPTGLLELAIVRSLRKKRSHALTDWACAAAFPLADRPAHPRH